jgi:hypothetical protein
MAALLAFAPGRHRLSAAGSPFARRAAAVGALVLLADQGAKTLARLWLAPCAGPSLRQCERVEFAGVAGLAHVQNAGSVLGLWQGLSLWLLLAAVGALLVPLYARHHPSMQLREGRGTRMPTTPSPHPPLPRSAPAVPFVYRDAHGRVHYLHRAVTPRHSLPPQVSYHFSQHREPEQTLAPLPPDYAVVVSAYTGRPYARKA